MALRSLLACAGFASFAAALNLHAERFPLSGGLLNGVSVTIKVEGWTDPSNHTIIDFAMPGGQVGLSFHFDSANQRIVRGRKAFGRDSILDVVDAEAWGPWPTSLTDKAFSMSFLKVGKTLKFGLDGVMLPWFDFTLSEEDSMKPLTHLFVWDGFTNPRVILSRPKCTEDCHPQECNCNSVGMCKAINAAKALCHHNLQNTATSEVLTCCTGQQPPLSISSPDVNDSWAVVTSLPNVDEAFPGATTGLEIGTIVKVKEVDQVQHLVKFWVPSVDTTDETILNMLPPELLLAKTTVRWINVSFATVYPDARETLAEFAGQVNYVNGIVAEGRYKDWFASLMHATRIAEENYEQDPWVKAIEDRVMFFGAEDEDSIQVVLTDQQVALPNCTDFGLNGVAELNWEDINENTCSDYEKNNFCDPTGAPLQAFKNKYPSKTFGQVGPPDWYAPRACCVCGGGQYGGQLGELPPDWATTWSQTADFTSSRFVV